MPLLKKQTNKQKTQQQLGLHQPPARAPHCVLAPPPSGSRSGSLGPERAAPPSKGPKSRRWFLGMRPSRVPEGGCGVGSASRGARAGRGAASRAGGLRRLAAPAGRAVCPCLSGGGPGSSSPHSSRGGATRSSAGTGRGGGDTHPWWRWRRRLLGPECHLRSRGCMPGARAAGTAAGLAPRGGRGLRSGPPPPPQAPAPAPPAAGRCGMGRVARYIPGAPRLGPARPRLRRSARRPACPSSPQSFRPATVLHLRNAPKNKPLVAQLAPLPVSHPSARLSQDSGLPGPLCSCSVLALWAPIGCIWGT